MSDMAMKYEDWLRGCVHHDGRKGNVYLPCDTVLAIADWIEAHRDAVPVVRCKDCKHWDEHSQYGFDSEHGVYGNYCMLWTPEDDFYAVETPEDGFCYCGERKDDETK